MYLNANIKAIEDIKLEEVIINNDINKEVLQKNIIENIKITVHIDKNIKSSIVVTISFEWKFF